MFAEHGGVHVLWRWLPCSGQVGRPANLLSFILQVVIDPAEFFSAGVLLGAQTMVVIVSKFQQSKIMKKFHTRRYVSARISMPSKSTVKVKKSNSSP